MAEAGWQMPEERLSFGPNSVMDIVYVIATLHCPDLSARFAVFRLLAVLFCAM